MSLIVELKEEAAEQEAGHVGDGAYAADLLRQAVVEIDRVRIDLDRVHKQRDHAWKVLAKVRSAVEAGDCDPMSLALHLAMCPRLQERDEYYAVVDREAADAEEGE